MLLIKHTYVADIQAGRQGTTLGYSLIVYMYISCVNVCQKVATLSVARVGSVFVRRRATPHDS